MEPFTFSSYRERFVPLSPSESKELFIFKPTDYTDLYTKVMSVYPEQVTILTDIKVSDASFQEKLTENILSKTNTLDFIPTCGCEYFSGKVYENEICPKCHERVSSEIEETAGMIPHKGWIECPDQIKGGFLHPLFYVQLDKWLKFKSTITDRSGDSPSNYLDVLLNPNFPIESPEIAQFVGNRTRGFSFVYENFEEIINFFANEFKKTAMMFVSIKMRYELAFYQSRAFTRRLPILTTALHTITKDLSESKQKRYTDDNCKYVTSALSILSYLKHSPGSRSRTIENIESRTFKAYKMLLNYIDDITIKQISKKKSIPRQQVYGSRMAMSFRTVIVPNLEVHEIDELILPWGIGVEIFKEEILNHLLRKGVYSQDAFRKYENATQNYDIDVHNILNKLLEDYKNKFNEYTNNRFNAKGYASLINRNPSLRESSISFVWISKIKPDPEDHVMEVSPMGCDGPNYDFDGDNMNGLKLQEIKEAVNFLVFHPSRVSLSKASPEMSSLFNVSQTGDLVLNTFLGMI